MARLPLPDEAPPGVEVWRLELALEAPLAQADWELLSEGERARALRLHRHADRLRSVAGRAGLRRLLAERVGAAPRQLEFASGAYGKPYLLHQSGLPSGAAASADMAFNVAHAGNCVLIALGAAPAVAALGVDVEMHDAGIELAALAAFALTPQECLAMHAAADPLADFFLRWSAKEAALKALGVGVGEYLRQVAIDRQDGKRLKCTHHMPDWPSLQICPLDVPGNFSAALAWHAA
ncbi:4'-phosphopantetheinyl transferase [Janthinobacterium sp. CG_23.3]|uniref:4'-phosphopantetheinyl transferase family protein n=1 Tax=unclassified Janthinobacterium TaxID=2610881 RepID=UPI0003470A02|nr:MULTISPECIES: 4'-phosphopantetheinyl transferase superfamily protein [unclassified Janthinobacterium]